MFCYFSVLSFFAKCQVMDGNLTEFLAKLYLESGIGKPKLGFCKG
uniref:Uncharacterized protein n=1 Tax=Candidatus Kentrum sp. TUN TaxID=2126343 RepID=A0A451A130_9GAMM|nr:MAG: hypothetical protein BECKTUN1418D_GA0071000_110711 [Candidatus Kentron sp. TUN]VFK60275.1 MAG: hypothetical protein BECKTUN1418F_GA0071002_12096 [Candidatus Kentron sp. TUN]VFK69725.1 MAG: hypothetical protein BECKTUN1418E_GA0071001_12096 [Candidatus Kentron sp. TUN]